jgi:hypothetical protein
LLFAVDYDANAEELQSANKKGPKTIVYPFQQGHPEARQVILRFRNPQTEPLIVPPYNGPKFPNRMQFFIAYS